MLVLIMGCNVTDPVCVVKLFNNTLKYIGDVTLIEGGTVHGEIETKNGTPDQ